VFSGQFPKNERSDYYMIQVWRSSLRVPRWEKYSTELQRETRFTNMYSRFSRTVALIFLEPMLNIYQAMSMFWPQARPYFVGQTRQYKKLHVWWPNICQISILNPWKLIKNYALQCQCLSCILPEVNFF